MNFGLPASEYPSYICEPPLTLSYNKKLGPTGETENITTVLPGTWVYSAGTLHRPWQWEIATPGLQLSAGDVKKQGLCGFHSGESHHSNISLQRLQNVILGHMLCSLCLGSCGIHVHLCGTGVFIRPALCYVILHTTFVHKSSMPGSLRNIVSYPTRI